MRNLTVKLSPQKYLQILKILFQKFIVLLYEKDLAQEIVWF